MGGGIDIYAICYTLTNGSFLVNHLAELRELGMKSEYFFLNWRIEMANTQKKYPVLTDTFCDRIETLRTALEVLTGLKARMLNLDLNTGRGTFLMGDSRVVAIHVDFQRVDIFHFIYDLLGHIDDDWHDAKIEADGSIRVSSQLNPKLRRGHEMVWIGTSFVDRRLVPLAPNAVKFYADKFGQTVEEYLAGSNN